MAKLNSEGSAVLWATVSNERTDRIHILDRAHPTAISNAELIAAGFRISLPQRHTFWHGINAMYAQQILDGHRYVVIGHTIWENTLESDTHAIWPLAYETPDYDKGEVRTFRSARTHIAACDIAKGEPLIRIVERAWTRSIEIAIRRKPFQLR